MVAEVYGRYPLHLEDESDSDAEVFVMPAQSKGQVQRPTADGKLQISVVMHQCSIFWKLGGKWHLTGNIYSSCN